MRDGEKEEGVMRIPDNTGQNSTIINKLDNWKGFKQIL